MACVIMRDGGGREFSLREREKRRKREGEREREDLDSQTCRQAGRQPQIANLFMCVHVVDISTIIQVRFYGNCQPPLMI